MSDFTSSIRNVAALYASTSVSSPKQVEQVATLIQNTTIDTVNFSQDSQNLFQIAQINSQFDEIFGIPTSLNEEDASLLDRLSAAAKTLFDRGALELSRADYDAILEDINTLYEEGSLVQGDPEEVATLTAQLQEYVQNISITQLFSQDSDNFFSTVSTNTLFAEQLSDSEKSELGQISLQLNRFLFSTNDSEASDFLDEINTLYGINSPLSDEENDILSLFRERNALLSSVLLNRDLNANYADLF